jgi:hypothetical protein
MMQRRLFDSSHSTAHADAAHKQHRRGDRKAVWLDGTNVRVLRTSQGDARAPATTTVTAGRRQSGFWSAVLDCLIEGFALYGASMHPTAHLSIPDYLAGSAARSKREKGAFADAPVDDTP